MTPTGLKRYQKTSVQTADKRQIILMLYEGAIKNLKLSMRDSNGALGPIALEKIGRTLEIINVLSAALDFNKGGEIAKNLDSLYAYMRDTLNEVLIKNAPEKIVDIINILSILLDGWKQITLPQKYNHPITQEKQSAQQLASLS